MYAGAGKKQFRTQLVDPRQQQQLQLFTYYCLCGEYVLITDKHLFHLPERRTDKALIIVKNEVTYKLNVAQNRTIVHVKRENGIERQERLHCKRCGLWVAYEPDEKSPILYLVDGALARSQSDAHTVLQLEGERRKEELQALAIQTAAQQNPLVVAQIAASVAAEVASSAGVGPAAAAAKPSST